MVGIIGGIFGGYTPHRPMKRPAREAQPEAVANTADRPATGQPPNLPVAIVARRPVNPVPIPHDLFLNQFTTPSTAAVASIAFGAPDLPDQQSLTELKAHSTYLAVASRGRS